MSHTSYTIIKEGNICTIFITTFIFRRKGRDLLEDLSSPALEKIYEPWMRRVKTAGTTVSFQEKIFFPVDVWQKTRY